MIYVHVPFCRSFCTYCDFYSETVCKGKDGKTMDGYVDCVCAEIAARKDEIRHTSSWNTLYFGGGTPSVLPLSSFSRIVHALPLKGFTEFTVEVNPDDILEKGRDYIDSLRSLGVNRISMGVQSFDDVVLKWMNRRHDSEGAALAFRSLRNSGIGNISIDLIFGLGKIEGADPDHFWKTLERFIALRPEHISAYQLSIEEGSALARMVEDGRYKEASDEECRSQYDLVCKRLSEAGYVHYEVSNWALPGYQAKHNSAYWSRQPYTGLGPGAHSFAILPGGRQQRSWNTEELRFWARSSENLTAEDIRVERIMLGLRTAEGLPAGELRSLCEPQILEEAVANGCLVEEGDRLRIPEDHFFVSDSIIRDLI